MKLSLKHQATEKTNSAACKVTEHHLNNNMLDFAIAKITGRYPEERLVVNRQCDELAYVFAGTGKIVVNNQEHLLNAGDVVLIESGDKYYWEGQMELFLSCRPAWNKEQHQLTD
jgi:mannose-6-phosphate isomerase-like protein (cupin superfamily)